MPKWNRANIAQMPTVEINILCDGAAMLFSDCPVLFYIILAALYNEYFICGYLRCKP